MERWTPAGPQGRVHPTPCDLWRVRVRLVHQCAASAVRGCTRSSQNRGVFKAEGLRPAKCQGSDTRNRVRYTGCGARVEGELHQSGLPRIGANPFLSIFQPWASISSRQSSLLLKVKIGYPQGTHTPVTGFQLAAYASLPSWQICVVSLLGAPGS